MIGGCTSIQDRGRLAETHSQRGTLVMNSLVHNPLTASRFGGSKRLITYCIYALHGAGLQDFTCWVGWRSSGIGGAFACL